MALIEIESQLRASVGHHGRPPPWPDSLGRPHLKELTHKGVVTELGLALET